MKTPLNKSRIQNHLLYSWWKYALVAAISLMGWSLIFSATAYRPPEEKKIVTGMYAYSEGVALQAFMDDARANILPEMEEISFEALMPDETYGDMILSTRVAARDYDLYVLPRDKFSSYAGQGAFMALEEVLPDLVKELEDAGISLSRGWRSINDPDTDKPTGERHLYGIPCADLPNASYLLETDTTDAYVSLFFETGNDENAIRFFELLIREMMKEPAVQTAAPAA